MAKLPVLSGEELIKLLRKTGFEIVGQKGSHVSLQKGEHKTMYHSMTNLRREHCWAS